MLHVAKHKKGKGFVALPVEGSAALGTIGDGAVVAANVHTGEFTEDFFAISADLQVQVRDLASGQGTPSSWGIAHGDYTVAEIQEHLGVSLLGPANKIEQERSRRLVRNVNSFESDPTEVDQIRSTDGEKRVKIRFMIEDGNHLNIWFKNRTGVAFTTGATLEWSGTLYGRWVR